MVFKKKKRTWKKKRKKVVTTEEEQAAQLQRIRLPRGNELLGYVDQLLGGKRMYVDCTDGKRRLCRVPGRYKRRVWVREGDYVIIKPWEIQGDEKADIIWKYRFFEVDYLKRKGKIEKI